MEDINMLILFKIALFYVNVIIIVVVSFIFKRINTLLIRNNLSV